MFVIFSVGVFCLPVSNADEKNQVVQNKVNSDEIVERLMIDAFSYKIITNADKPPSGYYIQFEHWNKGELKQTQSSKIFKLTPEAKNPSFFISFASLPSLYILVSPSAGDGEFREKLKFAVKLSDSSTSAFLEASSIDSLESGSSIVLGYQLSGIADIDSGIGVYDSTKEKPAKPPSDPLLTQLKAELKHLTDHKRDEVDVIVYRLIFK